jgi:CDP-diacylglycerol---serine O-phosphatidyltransferase
MKSEEAAAPTPVTMMSRHFFPTAVTMLSLCAGMTALFYANQDRISTAVGCVLLAAILDALDGRVARATGSASKFGAELDSLADVICFGAVPSFILYQWGLSAYGNLGWLACLTLPVAAAFRLARFNVMAETVKPAWAATYFTGIPAPAGAFLALTPVFVGNTELLPTGFDMVLALLMLPLVGALMTSTWPTFSGKSMGRRALGVWYLPTMVLLIVAAVGMFTFPWATLSASAGVYLATLPLSRRRYLILLGRQEPTVSP